ncbi:MAG: hypothetical protein GY847_14475 [Proteobacteria bacterium]|nr:hypothetical protein [Pseudomonadota bacterium]
MSKIRVSILKVPILDKWEWVATINGLVVNSYRNKDDRKHFYTRRRDAKIGFIRWAYGIGILCEYVEGDTCMYRPCDGDMCMSGECVDSPVEWVE